LWHQLLTTLAWTGTRPEKEARLLRWEQLNFAQGDYGELRVGSSKTKAGAGRVIPMSQALRAALDEHRAQCERWFGSVQPYWFVFPFSNRRRTIDPERPMVSLKKAWDAVRKQAGVTCRLYDFGRHSFCTKLAEAGVPESVMLDLMGHVSRAMLRRYSHIRADSRREAIRAVEARFGWGPQSFPQSQANDKSSHEAKQLKANPRAVSSAG
jgi:integrase